MKRYNVYVYFQCDADTEGEAEQKIKDLLNRYVPTELHSWGIDQALPDQEDEDE